MRCPLCNKILMDSPLALRGHYMHKHPEQDRKQLRERPLAKPDEAQRFLIERAIETRERHRKEKRLRKFGWWVT